LDLFEPRRGHAFLEADEVEKRVRPYLPAALKTFPFKIDMALQDPRPLNPLKMGDRQIYVYDAASQKVSEEPLTEILKYLPTEVARARGDCARPLAVLLDELAALRRDGATLVAGLAAADLGRGGRHPKVGVLRVGDLLQEWIHHDRNHIKQAMANVQAFVWPALGNSQKFSG